MRRHVLQPTAHNQPHKVRQPPAGVAVPGAWAGWSSQSLPAGMLLSCPSQWWLSRPLAPHPSRQRSTAGQTTRQQSLHSTTNTNLDAVSQQLMTAARLQRAALQGCSCKRADERSWLTVKHCPIFPLQVIIHLACDVLANVCRCGYRACWSRALLLSSHLWNGSTTGFNQSLTVPSVP
jgi:hypothetical protein